MDSPPDNFFSAVACGGDLDADACMQRFDADGDGALSLRELRALAAELFVDAAGAAYSVPARMCAELLFAFDADGDGRLCGDELRALCERFVAPVVRPACALLVIDVQNDFIDGSLAIRHCPAGQEGGEVVPVINNLLSDVPFPFVFYTYDWHPEDHVSFIDNVSLRPFHPSCAITEGEAHTFDTVVFEGPPPVEQKLWPRHCVQHSWGSQLHPDLSIATGAMFIYKGTCSGIDSYSAFWDNQKLSQTTLAAELRSRGVTDVFVTGLATEYCVGYTALHALEHGYRTVLVEDACRGVDLKDIQAMKDKLVAHHGVVVASDKVKDMALGLDRRPDLGYRTAMLAVNANNQDSTQQIE